MSLNEGCPLCYSLLMTLVCWMLSRRRYKIGVDAAGEKGLRDNNHCFAFTVRVVRFLFILVPSRRYPVRQLLLPPSGTLVDYDKRIAYS